MPRAESVDAARSAIVDSVHGTLPAEVVAIESACGRALARDLAPAHDLPPFDCSAMDGFAALPSEPGKQLHVIGESRAGHPFDGRLSPGEAIAISTGAIAPAGTGVAPVETVVLDGSAVTVLEGIAAGDHVRGAGEDIRSGTVALTAGTLLGPSHIQVAAACGRGQLEVASRPKLAIVATGDELVPAGTPLAPGLIHESNSVALRAIAEACGCDVIAATREPDSQDGIRQALAGMIAAADITIASGGVSVGEHDRVRPALRSLGVEEIFWRLPLKPGGPTWFGRSRSGGLVFGLPGNPVAAYVTFALLVRPAVRALQGIEPYVRRWPATLGAAVTLSARQQAVRVFLEPSPDRLPVVVPTGAQGSHRTASVAGADGVAMVPAGDGELDAGSRVEVEPLP